MQAALLDVDGKQCTGEGFPDRKHGKILDQTKPETSKRKKKALALMSTL